VAHCDVIELLLENGAYIEAVIDEFKYTSICAAVMNNQGKVVEMVIAKGANWNTLTNHPPSTQFKTPLQLAETVGLTGVVKILEIANKRRRRKEGVSKKEERGSEII
jgi:ankyrin repeat protein